MGRSDVRDIHGKSETVRTLTEALYLILLGCFLFYRVMGNTMFWDEWGLHRQPHAEDLWLVVIGLVILVKAFYLHCYRVLELLMAIVLCGSLFLSWRHTQIYWLQFLPLLIVGAKDVPLKKILRVYLWVNGTVLAAAVLGSSAGLIEEKLFVRSAVETGASTWFFRGSYGTTYPTTLSEFLFFFSAAWLYVRHQTLKWFDAVLLTGIALFLYTGPNARTDVVCVAGLAGCAFCGLVFRCFPRKAGWIVQKTASLFIAAFPICAAIMTVLMLLYDPNKAWMSALDARLNCRLSLGYAGMQTYGIHLFGTKVSYQMNTLKPDYFQLDCSYHMVLVNLGIVVFLLLIWIFTKIAYQAWKQKDYIMLAIIALIAVQCIMENRMAQVQYDIFLLAYWAGWGNTERMGLVL